MSPFAQSMLCLMNSGPPALKASKSVRTWPIPLRAGMVRALAATSNSPTRGQVKIPHVTAARCRDDYPAAARLATRSAASFSRQLLPSNFSRLPRCISRSRSGVTTTTSPRSVGQSSTGRFDVNTVEDLS